LLEQPLAAALGNDSLDIQSTAGFLTSCGRYRGIQKGRRSHVMKVLHWVLAPELLALLLIGSALAEDGEQIVPCKDIPAAVMAAFAKAYPNATIKSCAKEVEDGETSYEVASVENDVNRDVLYDPEGKLIVVEETIAITGVPKTVQSAVDKKFPKGEILLVEKLMRGSSVNYEFQIRDMGEVKEIVFDPAGNEVEP